MRLLHLQLTCFHTLVTRLLEDVLIFEAKGACQSHLGQYTFLKLRHILGDWLHRIRHSAHIHHLTDTEVNECLVHSETKQKNFFLSEYRKMVRNLTLDRQFRLFDCSEVKSTL